MDSVESVFDEKDNTLYCKAVAVIEANALDLLAFLWDYESEYFKVNKEKNDIKYKIMKRAEHILEVYDARKGEMTRYPQHIFIPSHTRR